MRNDLRALLLVASLLTVSAGGIATAQAPREDTAGPPVISVETMLDLQPRTAAQVARAGYFRRTGQILLPGDTTRPTIDDVTAPATGTSELRRLSAEDRVRFFVCEFDTVFVGTTTGRRVLMNLGRNGLFTEVDYTVDSVIRGTPGPVVTVAQSGGRAKVGGKEILDVDGSLPPLYDRALVLAATRRGLEGLVSIGNTFEIRDTQLLAFAPLPGNAIRISDASAILKRSLTGCPTFPR